MPRRENPGASESAWPERPLLRRESLDDDPLEQLRQWLDHATREGQPEPGAMTLATADRHGTPSARVVLYKESDEEAITFATNYESRKARELAENDRAALVLVWPALHRQIRVEGRVERAAASDSDRLFAARPRASRLSAWASEQSRPVTNRAWLEERAEEVKRRFTEDVPRPEFWGAYRLIPGSIEFWQGQRDRMHDRFLYRRQDDGTWTIDRLAP